MNWWEAILLGLVEGITEYLPVSSTGHLKLTQNLLGIAENDAADAYAICIQLGAILAVVGLYWPYVKRMILGLLGKDAAGLRLVGLLIAAFIPGAVVALSLEDLIKKRLDQMPYIAAAWLVGGIVILLWERWRSSKNGEDNGMQITDVTWKQAIGVGLFQCCAIWPGTSRSLSTIIGGGIMGLPLRIAVEFSFLLGMVTLSAATAYDGLKHGETMLAEYGIVTILIGLVVAFFSALLAVKWMVAALKKYGLSIYGWYRIALALTVFGLLSFTNLLIAA